MNTLTGTITQITTEDPINLITIEVKGTHIFAVTLQLAPEFQKGNTVVLMFKESEIVLSKTASALIGVENCIPVTISRTTTGKIFSELALTSSLGDFIALVTNVSLSGFTITEGEEYYALIKANEISLGGDL